MPGNNQVRNIVIGTATKGRNYNFGKMGSANLAVVAPGISDALITTAMGLAAAIPAAFFFNLYNSRIKVLSSMMDDFALEFLNIVERNFT